MQSEECGGVVALVRTNIKEYRVDRLQHLRELLVPVEAGAWIRRQHGGRVPRAVERNSVLRGDSLWWRVAHSMLLVHRVELFVLGDESVGLPSEAMALGWLAQFVGRHTQP